MEQYNPKNPDLYKQVELPPPPPPTLNIVPLAQGMSTIKEGFFQSKNFRTDRAGYRLSETLLEAYKAKISGTFILGGTLITVDNIDDLQPTIDFLENLGGGTVSLVPDTYNVTSSITIPSGVTLDGNGATIDFGGGAFQVLIEGTNAYSTGTVSINYGQTTVVGVGTTFTSAMVGRNILLGDYWYEIATFTDTTHIELVSSFVGTDLSGDTYVIATTVDNVVIKNITLTNSSIAAFKFRYVNVMVIDGLFCSDSPLGVDGDDSSGISYLNAGIFDSVAGLDFDNVPFCFMQNFNMLNITGGTAMDLTRVSNTAIMGNTTQAIVGVGVKFTNCYNLGFINYAIIQCTSHGIEFVSGNRDMDMIAGYTDDVGGDGIKFTATSDKINLSGQAIRNTTGYGVNISASSCDENVILCPNFTNCTAGNINDAGTGTFIFPQTVGSNVQSFTSSGTWTKPSSGSFAFIQAWGGGGSGGKSSATKGGGGGGGGGYVERFLPLSTLGATETVTIGAGGVAQTTANTDGNVGGNTTFGTLLTAYGGGGGDGGSGANGGGGGGGGALGVGAVGSGRDGGLGGSPSINATNGIGKGGVGVAGTVNTDGGGGGGSGGSGSVGFSGGLAVNGGGGGAGGSDVATNTAVGGNSLNGGGGGGGGSGGTSAGTGGTSINGGNGGAGAFDSNNATAGSQPGGGGGGSEEGNSGAGGAGKVVVTTF